MHAVILKGTIMSPELQQLRDDLKGDIAVSEERLKGDIAASEERLKGDMAASEERLKEFIRDTQTEILRGLENLTRGYDPRLQKLEAFDGTATQRLANLEEQTTRMWIALQKKGLL